MDDCGKMRTLTATVVIDVTDRYLFLDGTAGGFTATLPSALGRKKHTILIVRVDDTDNTITVAGNGGETINELPSVDFTHRWQTMEIISNGTNYVETSNSSAPIRFTGSATLTFGAIQGQTFVDQTIGVTGARPGDCVQLGIPSGVMPNTIADGLLGLFAFCDGDDLVTVRLTNNDALPNFTPSIAGVFNVIVTRI